jgi:hypothetical protein
MMLGVEPGDGLDRFFDVDRQDRWLRPFQALAIL